MFPIAAIGDQARRPVPPDRDPLRRSPRSSSSRCCGAFEGRKALRTDGRGRELFVLGSLGFAGFNLLTYVGLEHTRPQNAALIVALQPLITALAPLADDAPDADAAHVRRDGRRAVRRRARDHPAATRRRCSTATAARGDLLVLIGCACWIVYTLGARRFTDFSPLRYTALSADRGTLTIFAVTAIVTLTGASALPSAGDAALWWQTPTSSSPAPWSPCWPGTRACAGSAPPTARCS